MADRIRDPAFRRPATIVAIVLAVAIGVTAGLLASGGGDEHASSTTTTSAQPSAGVLRGSFLTSVIPAASAAASEARGIDRALAALTPEQKVGQVFLWGLDLGQAGPAAVKGLHDRGLGGVALTGAGPARVRSIARSLRTGPHPPLVMAEQTGGEFDAIKGLPPATAPADLRGAAAGAREAAGAARVLGSAGLDGVLAPALDVGPPDNPAVGARAFSESARATSRYARGVVSAYDDGGLFAAAGPFPGLGSGSQPVEQGPANVGSSKGQLARTDLAPFRAAIAAGVPGIVISNGLYVYDDFVTPASLSHTVMVDLLRRQLGFGGVAITGDLTDAGVTALQSPARAAVAALKAGADLLYISGPRNDQDAAYRAVLAAVQSKKIAPARLDQAVRRVLTAKHDYGGGS